MGQLKQRFQSRTAGSHNDHAGDGMEDEGVEFKKEITNMVLESRISGEKNACWYRKPLSLLIALLFVIIVILLQQREWAGLLRRTTTISRQQRVHNLFYWDSNNVFVQRTILVSIIRPAADEWMLHSQRHLNYNDDGGDEIDYNDMDSRAVFPDELKACHPQAAWQTANYQTCNTLHEIMLLQEHHTMQFLNCGSSRCAFRVDNVVLKTVKLHSDASFEPYARMTANTDSVALEHLTASPYVMNIYGSCSIAKVVEYSSQGSLHDVIKESRLQEKVKDEVQLHPRGASWQDEDVDHDRHTIPAEYHRHQYTTPMEKLKIAYQLLVAVADMHGLEQSAAGTMPMMLHNDLCCHQYVLVDGVYKLGDMDTITFVTVEELYQRQEAGVRGAAATKTQKVCQTTPLIWEYESLKAVAPEELIYYDDNATKIALARDKIDVHKIGSTLYTLLTNWWEWEGYHARSVIVKKFQGEFPPFPAENTTAQLLSSTQDLAALQALREAVLMAWTPNPNKRPSARAISNFLLPTIRQFQPKNDDSTIVRVSLPPLTPNHRFTDSDFMSRWYTGSNLE